MDDKKLDWEDLSNQGIQAAIDAMTNSTEDNYALELPLGNQELIKPVVCECGVDSLGAGLHSQWCPKRSDNE